MSVSQDNNGLTHHADWVLKVVQLYETQLVRHGIMLVGPSCGGKTRVLQVLSEALSVTVGQNHKMARMNPKAIRAQEMYGEVDLLSGEWTTGCFAAIWTKCNSREQKNVMWITMDGPVDAIWIEDLNTVLDDNKILTLANGDRIPMSETTKLMFEVETLKNASPATVSRAGQVYVSDTDLDWGPPLASWIATRPEKEQELLRPLMLQYMGEVSPVDPGPLFNFMVRELHITMDLARVGHIQAFQSLFAALIDNNTGCKQNLSSDPELYKTQIERLVLYCLTWSMGGLFESIDRSKFDAYLRTLNTTETMPECGENETIFEYFVDR
jgi:dynein heavy chain